MHGLSMPDMGKNKVNQLLIFSFFVENFHSNKKGLSVYVGGERADTDPTSHF